VALCACDQESAPDLLVQAGLDPFQFRLHSMPQVRKNQKPTM
jgi:hypothetical protein